LKVSVITVSYNSNATIEDAILSVSGQTHENKEHIVIDGGSIDGTYERILKNRHRLSNFISEKDRGIYDAMNKGLNLADGDVIGFLNSDDIYADNSILAEVVYRMKSNGLDCVFGDLVYVDQHDTNRIVRYYSSKDFSLKQISIGYMPAHPTIFFHKSVYEKYGLFKIDYKISGDFEYVARVFRNRELRYAYIPKIMVKMRTGGTSTRNLRSSWILNMEVLRACRENGINTNILKLFLKYPSKILGLFNKNFL
jgi:glycosyltransferase involved in cell wall biosynthesis